MKDYEDICLILVQQLCALVATCDHSTYERKGTMGDKVLVVDDEVVVTSFLSDYLTGEGYEVILASNGEEALELAEKEKPQLILLDIRMPGIDGIEVCKRLKAQEKTRSIPVIMMTGFAYEKVDAVEAGADEFINKPLDPVELVFRLKSISRMRYLTDELDKAVAEIEGPQESSHEREAESTEGIKNSGIVVDKILVVDDELVVRGFLHELLAEEGYEVILASNGEEAIDLAERENPEVILLDINMPGIDGIEVCKRLKAQEETRNIPIIIVTALDDRGFIAYLEGADDFVTKPFNPVELTFRIRSMHRIKQLNIELLIARGYIRQLEKDLFKLQKSGSTD